MHTLFHTHTHTSCISITVFCKIKSDISKNCNLQVFPLDGAKHISRNSRQTSNYVCLIWEKVGGLGGELQPLQPTGSYAGRRVQGCLLCVPVRLAGGVGWGGGGAEADESEHTPNTASCHMGIKLMARLLHGAPPLGIIIIKQVFSGSVFHSFPFVLTRNFTPPLQAFSCLRCQRKKNMNV